MGKITLLKIIYFFCSKILQKQKIILSLYLKTINNKTMSKETLYWVDWYRDGYCYRSSHSVSKEELKECRRMAKMLGEKLVIEKM